MKLYPHQIEALEAVKLFNRCAFYADMGLGKTFMGSEKANSFSQKILVVCQKSKIQDWIDHFTEYYGMDVFDLTVKKQLPQYLAMIGKCVGVINYDLVYRRKELETMNDFTLMLDESSIIQNETTKRAKFILKMHAANVILISGTPISGKYEFLWSQIHLLGWPISKNLYWQQYIITEWVDQGGFMVPRVAGYRNVDRLKEKLAEYGAVFQKSEEVFDLPDQIFQDIRMPTTKEYRKFQKEKIITVDGKELVGDTSLTAMLYERMLCGSYNQNKLDAFRDLLESTNGRLIVFYNFNAELDALRAIANDLNRPHGAVNGDERNLKPYEEAENSITFVQYQAGSKGLNLQLANRVVYFTPTLSCENWMQSQKRIHRIGQDKTCFYYRLTCRNSIEERIYASLQRGVDYTDKLFEKEG